MRLAGNFERGGCGEGIKVPRPSVTIDKSIDSPVPKYSSLTTYSLPQSGSAKSSPSREIRISQSQGLQPSRRLFEPASPIDQASSTSIQADSPEKYFTANDYRSEALFASFIQGKQFYA